MHVVMASGRNEPVGVLGAILAHDPSSRGGGGGGGACRHGTLLGDGAVGVADERDVGVMRLRNRNSCSYEEQQQQQQRRALPPPRFDARAAKKESHGRGYESYGYKKNGLLAEKGGGGRDGFSDERDGDGDERDRRREPVDDKPENRLQEEDRGEQQAVGDPREDEVATENEKDDDEDDEAEDGENEIENDEDEQEEEEESGVEIDGADSSDEPPQMVTLFGSAGEPSLIMKDSTSLTIQWAACEALGKDKEGDAEDSTAAAAAAAAATYGLSYEAQMQRVDVPSGMTTPKSSAMLSQVKPEAWRTVYTGKELWTQICSLRAGRYYAVRVLGILSCDVPGKLLEAPDPSPIAMFHTTPTVPRAPQPPCLSLREHNSLKFKWTAPKEHGGLKIQDYKLQIRPAPLNMLDAEEEDGFTEVYCGPSHDFQVEQLQPSVKYTARVKAKNELGESPWSLLSSFKSKSSPPSIPGNLFGSPISPECVVLQWVPPCDNGCKIDSYNVNIEDVNAGHVTSIRCTSTPRCDIKGLKGGTSYALQVRAHNQVGMSSWSEPIIVKTPSSVPGRPPIPTAVALTKTAVVFTWKRPLDTGGSEVDNYEAEIHWRSSQGGSSDDVGSKRKVVYSGSATSYTADELLPGSSYRFRVKAHNEAGWGTWSQEVSIKLTPGVPDRPPEPAVICNTSKSLRIQWSRPGHDGGAPISEYKLEYCQCCKSPRECDDPFEVAYCGQQCETKLVNLSPGTEYAFRVSASNNCGTSEWSSVGRGMTRAAVPLAPAPPGLCQSDFNFLALCWSAPDCQGSPITNYSVEMAVKHSHFQTSLSGKNDLEDSSTDLQGNQNGEYGEISFKEVYQGTNTSCSIPDLQANTEYWVRVQATNKVGNSLWSDPVSFLTKIAPPSSPRELQIKDASSDSISLCWLRPQYSNGAEVNTYIVEGCSSHSKKPSWKQKYKGPSTHCKVQHLRCGSEYQFRVRAGNSKGLGPFCCPITACSAPAAPAAPEPLLVCQRTATSVKLKWQPPRENGAPVELYKLDMAEEGGAFNEVYSGLLTSHKVSGLMPGNRYLCKVRGVNAAGDGEWSATTSVETPLAPPPMPENVSVTTYLDEAADGGIQGDCAALVISWDRPSLPKNCAPVASYEVEAFSSKDRPRSSPVRKVLDCKYTIGQLPAGTSFAVRIRAVGANSTGHSNWSEQVTAITPGWKNRPSTPSDSGSSGNLVPSISVGSRSSRSQTSDASEELSQCARATSRSVVKKGPNQYRPRPRPKKPLLKTLKPYFEIGLVILIVILFCLLLSSHG